MTSRRPAEALLRHLRDAKDLMDRAYAEPLDLDALADRAGYSRYHFLRAFRRAFGETPRAHLTRRRIERAKDLLRLVNLTVTEVCFLVGFSSLGSFSARFAELGGVAPTEYRDPVVQRGGPPPIPGCFMLMWTRPHQSASDGAIRKKPSDGRSGYHAVDGLRKEAHG
jgi:transcriptional regulator GlxA family with amidase domain